MDSNPQKNIFRKESLERLSSPEQLDQLMQVVRPRSWIPLATLASLMGLAILWSIFGRIPITTIGTGILVLSPSNKLVGITYFERGEGERIQPGMTIVIIPDTTRSERIGGLVGRVTEVSKPPITTLEMIRQGADADASQLQMVPIKVQAELERDPSTVSGYRWSSVSGRRLTVNPGVTTTARVTVESRAPITFVFPFLEVSP